MRAGSQRNPIEIQRKVQVGVDSLNAPNMVWQTWREPFAELTVLRGREHFDSQTKQRYSEEVWQFRVRYVEVEGIDASMRVVYDGTEFDIKAIRPDGQKRVDCIIECTVQDAVLGAAPLAIAIKQAIQQGKVGVVYGGFSLSAAGGSGAGYIFAIASGALPAGLSMNASTGAIAGTPSATGTSAVTFKVTDSAGEVAALPSIDLTVTA
ncbi:phage head completion protein [Mesorhizobium silamurunense]|uniref:phage head completion protein n=1 Tax=Mesorhizobium silamurunense TaxID=499528 RepID=UPI001AED8E93|nr:putative Ig domain-containing protein [Mesorhizobium silamurunense]